VAVPIRKRWVELILSKANGQSETSDLLNVNKIRDRTGVDKMPR